MKHKTNIRHTKIYKRWLVCVCHHPSSSLVCCVHYVFLFAMFSQLEVDIVNMSRTVFFSAINDSTLRCVPS